MRQWTLFTRGLSKKATKLRSQLLLLESSVEALRSALADLPVPVLYDVDIGHHPPQLNLINGAVAEVHYEEAKGWVRQKLI